MTIDGDVPLADLVTARPELAPRLADLGLDFCCGGARTLGEAVAAAGLRLGEVVDGLDEVAAAEQPDWVAMAPVELIDHLESTHHQLLRERLPYLSGVAAKVAEVHGANHPELAAVASTFEELRADLEPHLLEEEQVLFPRVRELYADDEPCDPDHGRLQDPIGVLCAEHDRAGELLARLRELTDDYEPPPDGCASYRALYAGLAELEADTHLHVHKENNVLFPAVVAEEASRA